MTKNQDPKKESLAEIAVDPDVLARELALEIEIDPLDQIDEDAFSKGLNITQECNEALKMLEGSREERIQGLRILIHGGRRHHISWQPNSCTNSKKSYSK